MDEPTSLLITAVTTGEVAVVRDLIARGANVNYHEPRSQLSPLAIAVINDHSVVVDILAKHGARVNHCKDSALVETPLHFACREGYNETVRVLIDHKADVNAHVPGVKSPLGVAVSRRNDSLAKMLLDNQADPNYVDKTNNTPLMHAYHASDQMFRMLLEHGADPGAMEPSGQKCLNSFIWCSQFNKIELALKHRADPNANPFSQRDKTYLAMALRFGHLDIARLLVKYGAATGPGAREHVLPALRGQFDSLSTLPIPCVCKHTSNAAV